VLPRLSAARCSRGITYHGASERCNQAVGPKLSLGGFGRVATRETAANLEKWHFGRSFTGICPPFMEYRSANYQGSSLRILFDPVKNPGFIENTYRVCCGPGVYAQTLAAMTIRDFGHRERLACVSDAPSTARYASSWEYLHCHTLQMTPAHVTARQAPKIRREKLALASHTDGQQCT